MFPLMFLSGVFIPRFIMPEFLLKFTDFVPLTPVNDGIRLIVTENYELWQLLPQIGVIGIWMIVLYAIAFKVFRWE
jgi:ABC-2 type transport system permease protein